MTLAEFITRVEACGRCHHLGQRLHAEACGHQMVVRTDLQPEGDTNLFTSVVAAYDPTHEEGIWVVARNPRAQALTEALTAMNRQVFVGESETAALLSAYMGFAGYMRVKMGMGTGKGTTGA